MLFRLGPEKTDDYKKDDGEDDRLILSLQQHIQIETHRETAPTLLSTHAAPP